MRWIVVFLAMMAAFSAGCQDCQDVSGWSGDQLAVGIRPEHIVCRDGRLYIAGGTHILVLDEKTGRLLRRFDGLSRYGAWRDDRDADGNVVCARGEWHPCHVGAIAVAGNRLFATEVFAGDLLVFDLDAWGAPMRLKMPDQGVLAAAPSGKEAYYASNEDAFYRIDARSLQAYRVPYPRGARGIGGALVSPDGRTLYLAIQRGAREAGAKAPPSIAGLANRSGPLLAEYDLVERRYVALRSIGDTRVERDDDASIPTSLCVSDDGKSLYITLWQCGIGVHVYDVADHCLREPIVLPDAPGLNWPNCWSAAQAGNDLYVTLDHQTHLVRVNIARGRSTEMGTSDKAICRGGGNLYISISNGIRRIRL
jgi:hypothetical protein